jgi:hypothetical protein
MTIRADREAYYYGRETLWQSHPDIVKVLCVNNCDDILQVCISVCTVTHIYVCVGIIYMRVYDYKL